MWQLLGSQNYNAGLSNYLSPRKSVAVPQKLSSDGMERTALFCGSRERPQADLVPTASPQYMASAITSSPLTISPTYLRKWLGNSTEPLSDCDRIAIHTILHLRIALQSGGFFAMGTAALLVFGIAISKGLPKVLHYDNSRPVVQSRGWR